MTPERIQFGAYFVSDREDPQATQAFHRCFTSARGSRTVVRAEAPIPLGRPS